MRVFTRLQRHREFIRHVATMMSGRTVAAAIALFTMPIVARLFSPSDFGVASVFASVTSVLGNIAVLRYDLALALPKSEEEAVNLLRFAYCVLLATSGLVLLAITVYAVSPMTWDAMELLGDWVWLLPFAIALAGAHEIQESWLARSKAFAAASTALVIGNTTTSATRIAFGFAFGSSVYGLIVGHVLGLAGRFAVQQFAFKYRLSSLLRRIRGSDLRGVARRYSDFPRLNAPAGLVFSLGQNLPILLFGVLYSPAIAGFYAMAHRLFQAPVAIVSNAIRRVFLQKAAQIANDGGTLRKAFLLATTGLALLGVAPLMCLWIAGQPLLVWLLGDTWMTAGRYVEIMAPLLFTAWIATPCNPVFVVLRKQTIWLSLQVSLTSLRLAVLAAAYALSAGPETTLRAFVLATVTGNIGTIVGAYLLIVVDSKRTRLGRLVNVD